MKIIKQKSCRSEIVHKISLSTKTLHNSFYKCTAGYCSMNWKLSLGLYCITGKHIKFGIGRRHLSSLMSYFLLFKGNSFTVVKKSVKYVCVHCTIAGFAN